MSDRLFADGGYFCFKYTKGLRNTKSYQRDLKTLFGRNKIKYEEYIKKYSDHIIMEPTEAPEIELNNLVVSDKNELQILDNEDFVKMRDLLNNYEGLIKLLKDSNNKVDIVEGLIIDKDILEETDLKTTSFRVSRRQLKRFDRITKKNKGYLKAQVFNQMLKEFCDKYEN